MGCFLEGLGGFAAGGFKDSLARPVFHGEWVSRVGGVVLLYCGADGGVFRAGELDDDDLHFIKDAYGCGRRRRGLHHGFDEKGLGVGDGVCPAEPVVDRSFAHADFFREFLAGYALPLNPRFDFLYLFHGATLPRFFRAVKANTEKSGYFFQKNLNFLLTSTENSVK